MLFGPCLLLLLLSACPIISQHIFLLNSLAARGFGMRVVGGKTGADGRLFAYIVWTVPGGPAEKNGLQQGDKVSRVCVRGGRCVFNKLPKSIINVTERERENVCSKLIDGQLSWCLASDKFKFDKRQCGNVVNFTAACQRFGL